MKKENVIKVFEMVEKILQEMHNKIEEENWNNEFNEDKFEQEEVIHDLLHRISQKIAILNNEKRAFKPVDYFPDLQEVSGQIINNKFFKYNQIVQIEFLLTEEVAEMIGWTYEEVMSRMEELPHPIYQGAITLWNKKDIEEYLTHKDKHCTLNEVVTVSEAAKILNVSERHVRRLCEANKIASRQTKEGTWLVGRSYLDEYKNVLHPENLAE